MLKDADAIKDIREKWEAACTFKERVSALTNMAGMNLPNEVRHISHNLVFLVAFQCFDDVLRSLEKEGTINIHSAGSDRKIPRLEQILKAGKNQISWKDWEEASKINGARNDVAHGREILSRAKCWEYIDYIKNQLLEWKILSQ